MPVMFSLGMGISVVSNKQTLKINNIQTSTKSQISQKSKKENFVRKQYQKSHTFHEKNKNIINSKIIDNTNLLAQVETREYVQISKNVIQDQKMHPLNASQIKSHKVNTNKTINKTKTKSVVTNNKRATSSNKKNIDITAQLQELQIIVNKLDAKPKVAHKRTKKNVSIGKNKSRDLNQIGYWQTVYSIESKQGKLLYRPRNKARNCNYTLGPCGHHQLTVQALRDIGCKSLQCRKDRLDYQKSLKLSKKLLALNEKRLKKDGLTNLQGYQKYLIHQQGANGIKNIIAATKGKKELSKTIKKNMANNSPYSYRQFKRMGSKIAAKKFMQHWERKWMSEKRLILASNSKSTNNQRNKRAIPTFDDNDLNYALNLMF